MLGEERRFKFEAFWFIPIEMCSDSKKSLGEYPNDVIQVHVKKLLNFEHNEVRTINKSIADIVVVI